MLFCRLEDIGINIEEYGFEAISLKKLDNENIDVLKSIILTHECFQLYNLSKSFENTRKNEIFEFINEEFPNEEQLFLRISVYKRINGLYDNLQANNTVDDLINKIELIYKSWENNHAQAYRVTYKLRNIDTYPCIIIQPYKFPIFSLVTRCPKNGEPTCNENLNNIHNYVDKFDQKLADLAESVEYTLGEPIKFYFSGKKSICGVKHEEMTNEARFYFLRDLLQKGQINEIDFLLNIEPRFISRLQKISYVPSKNDSFIQLKGIPGQPGIVVGSLLIYSQIDNEILSLSNKIVIFSSFYPNDVPIVINSLGVLSNEGGATSHLAVISRQFGIPSVVGLSKININYDEKKIYCSSQCFSEGSSVMFDGENGLVYLSSEPFDLSKRYSYTPCIDNVNLKKVFDLLNKYSSNIGIFKKLPVNIQNHLSRLTYEFKKIGYINNEK